MLSHTGTGAKAPVWCWWIFWWHFLVCPACPSCVRPLSDVSDRFLVTGHNRTFSGHYYLTKRNRSHQNVASMVRTGPCAVRAVVGGDIKCHCELGTAKRFFEGTKPPYVGLDVCDAYRCKKDGGVKVEKTGLHKRADKRPRTEGGGSGSGGGGCSGRGGDGISADFLRSSCSSCAPIRSSGIGSTM